MLEYNGDCFKFESEAWRAQLLIADGATNAAHLNGRKSDWRSALNKFRKLLNSAESTEGMIKANCGLAESFIGLKNFNLAIRYAGRAVKLAQSLKGDCPNFLYQLAQEMYNLSAQKRKST